MSTKKFRVALRARRSGDPALADAPRGRYDAGPMDETATARVTGVAQVFDLHALKAFAPWAVLILLLFAAGVWIVFQPMQMRGTLPGAG